MQLSVGPYRIIFIDIDIFTFIMFVLSISISARDVMIINKAKDVLQDR